MTTNTTTNAKQVVKMPMIFDQAQLDSRFDQAKYEYMNGVYTYFEASQMGSWSYPATEVHTFGYVDQMVDFLIEAAAKGQHRFKGESITAQPGFCAVRVYKQQEEIDAALLVLRAKVEQDYIASIEEHNELQKTLLIEQLVAQEEAKTRKAEEQRMAAVVAQATADAEAYIKGVLDKQSKQFKSKKGE